MQTTGQSDPTPLPHTAFPAQGRSLATSASWLFQLTAAGILGSTLFFKFTAAPESVALFERLGVEPWGRLGLGILELAAVLLLLRGRTAVLGALAVLGLMTGAIGTHLALLGIEVDGDGGALFAMAVAAFGSALAVLALRRGELAPRIARPVERLGRGAGEGG